MEKYWYCRGSFWMQDQGCSCSLTADFLRLPSFGLASSESPVWLPWSRFLRTNCVNDLQKQYFQLENPLRRHAMHFCASSPSGFEFFGTYMFILGHNLSLFVCIARIREGPKTCAVSIGVDETRAN